MAIFPLSPVACDQSWRHLSGQSDWRIIVGMANADPQNSGNPILGEESAALSEMPISGGKPDDYWLASTGYLRPRRPGVYHWLAFIVLAAGLAALHTLALYNILEKYPVIAFHQAIMTRHVVQVITDAVTAASWVGVAILVAAKIRGLPGRFQPGHWILIFQGTATVLGLLIWAVRYLVVSNIYLASRRTDNLNGI